MTEIPKSTKLVVSSVDGLILTECDSAGDFKFTVLPQTPKLQAAYLKMKAAQREYHRERAEEYRRVKSEGRTSGTSQPS